MFKLNSILSSISKNKSIFNLFTQVYVFGSVLNSKNSNDFDLLLVYHEYLEELQNQKNTISLFLEKLCTVPIDITMLSEQERAETKFLEKLELKYERIK